VQLKTLLGPSRLRGGVRAEGLNEVQSRRGSPEEEARLCYRAAVKTDITEAEYQELERLITSDASPVGIDAKKTLVLILNKLTQTEARLARLEASQKP